MVFHECQQANQAKKKSEEEVRGEWNEQSNSPHFPTALLTLIGQIFY